MRALKTIAAVAALVVAAAVTALTQASVAVDEAKLLRFEAASIKRSTGDGFTGFRIDGTGFRVARDG